MLLVDIQSNVSSFHLKDFTKHSSNYENFGKIRDHFRRSRYIMLFACAHTLEHTDNLMCPWNFSYDTWQKYFRWLEFQLVDFNILTSHYIQFVGIQSGKKNNPENSKYYFDNVFGGTFRKLEMR